MKKTTIELVCKLRDLGFDLDEALALRRIEMTLSRWGERECGDGNEYGSWAIERDDETEKPFLVHHHFNHGHGKDTVTRTPIPDREAGAMRRLSKIMAAHANLVAYHQTDPRGCALYILDRSQVNGDDISTIYTRGLAVCD